MLKPSFLSNEYLVSDEGYVLSKRFNKPLKPSINHNGYSIINTRINGKTKGVGKFRQSSTLDIMDVLKRSTRYAILTPKQHYDHNSNY